jgi:hypothetical protein
MMNLQRVAFPTTVTQQILHLQQEMAQIAIWKEQENLLRPFPHLLSKKLGTLPNYLNSY